MFNELFEAVINELTLSGLKRKQKSITRLFPTFPDRVKAVADKGGVRLVQATNQYWHFKVHSGTKNNVWYDVYFNWKNVPETLNKIIRDRRYWIKDKSRVDKKKVARRFMETADVEIDCSCPADTFYGGEYIRSKDKYKAQFGDQENRPPNIRNKKQYGILCKHSQNIMRVLPFYNDTMMSWLEDFYLDTILKIEQRAKKEFGWSKMIKKELKRRKIRRPERPEKEPEEKEEQEVEEPEEVEAETEITKESICESLPKLQQKYLSIWKKEGGVLFGPENIEYEFWLLSDGKILNTERHKDIVDKLKISWDDFLITGAIRGNLQKNNLSLNLEKHYKSKITQYQTDKIMEVIKFNDVEIVYIDSTKNDATEVVKEKIVKFSDFNREKIFLNKVKQAILNL